jgi:type VI protein secretion system component VasK
MGLAASPDQDLWWLTLAAGSIVVVVLCLLLGLVINVLRQIDRHAARTHTAAKQIAQNTVALWALEQTNRDLIAIRDAARGAARSGAGSPLAGPLSAVSQKVHNVFGRAEPRDDGSS